VRLWYFLLVARFARVIALDTPHHVTQRGNARQFILATDAERLVDLDLLRHYGSLHRISLVGDCLMSNHVHLIVIPKQLDSSAATLKNTHGRYAAYGNAQHKSSGHVWQGRSYSCPLGGTHLWEALRYTELNPARAGRVAAEGFLSVVQRRCSLRDGAARRLGDVVAGRVFVVVVDAIGGWLFHFIDRVEGANCDRPWLISYSLNGTFTSA
jgi:REP element-mobilizing transposase RayT